MMASSKDKAIALKDNYVAGLIEAGATAPMPTMPEQNMGNVAGEVRHIGRGEVYGFNDGNPTLVLTDGKKKFKMRNPGSAYPAPGGQGAFGAGTMSREARTAAADIIHNPLFEDSLKGVNYYGGPQSYKEEYNHLLR